MAKKTGSSNPAPAPAAESRRTINLAEHEEGWLDRVDEFARTRGMSLSAYIRNAVIERFEKDTLTKGVRGNQA